MTTKTSSIRLWALGQISYSTDDLMEDKILSFGVEGQIAEDGQVDQQPTSCAPTAQILTNYTVNQLNAAIPFEPRRSNYGIDNFVN